MFFKIALLTFLIGFSAWGLPTASSARYDEFEGVQLIEQLALDGYYDEALFELSRQKDKSRPELENRIRAQKEIQKELWSKASSYIDKAESQAAKRELDLVLLLKGKINFHLKNFKECARAYQTSRLSLPLENRLQKAWCEERNGEAEAAWSTLAKAPPEDAEKNNVMFAKFSLQLHMGLRQEAIALAKKYLLKPSASVSDALLFAGELKDVAFFEWCRMRFYNNLEVKDIILQMTALYYEKGWLNTVADNFATVARIDSSYNFHTAEMFRQLNQVPTAIFFALQIADKKKKQRHDLAGLIDRKRWAEVRVLGRTQGASELGADAQYALAFSEVHFLSYEKALAQLERIEDPRYEAKIAALKKLITKQ